MLFRSCDFLSPEFDQSLTSGAKAKQKPKMQKMLCSFCLSFDRLNKFLDQKWARNSYFCLKKPEQASFGAKLAIRPVFVCRSQNSYSKQISRRCRTTPACSWDLATHTQEARPNISSLINFQLPNAPCG